MTDKKNIYLTIHKNFVREGISFVDERTGEAKTFNSVTLPKDTIIDGRDMSYYQFSPLFVNESRFKGADYRDVPLLANKEVWLTKDVLDAEGNHVIGADGRYAKDTVKVMPAAIKDALDASRSRYLQEQNKGRDTRSLNERAQGARASSSVLGKGDVLYDTKMH